MSWTVEWSSTDEAQEQSQDGTPNIYIARGGRKDAFLAAKSYLDEGHIVWAIKDDNGNLEMERHAVFHHFFPLSS
jgi:hypothetical protein